jgi:hypothetical protein
MERIQRAKAIDALLDALEEVVQSDRGLLRAVIEESGVPEGNQRIRYLKFNRQRLRQKNRTITFSVVAVIHNRTMSKYRLRGIARRLSRRIFSFSRNRMDVFLNNLRCDDRLPDQLERSSVPYSLFCMLQVDEVRPGRFFRRYYRRIRPAVIVCGLNPDERRRVEAFEEANEVLLAKRFGLPIYKRVDMLDVCALRSP